MERICITIEGGLILHGDVLVCSFVGITVVSLKSRFATVISLHNEVVSLQVVSPHHEVDSPQPVFCINQFKTI